MLGTNIFRFRRRKHLLRRAAKNHYELGEHCLDGVNFVNPAALRLAISPPNSDEFKQKKLTLTGFSVSGLQLVASPEVDAAFVMFYVQLDRSKLGIYGHKPEIKDRLR